MVVILEITSVQSFNKQLKLFFGWSNMSFVLVVYTQHRLFLDKIEELLVGISWSRFLIKLRCNCLTSILWEATIRYQVCDELEVHMYLPKKIPESRQRITFEWNNTWSRWLKTWQCFPYDSRVIEIVTVTIMWLYCGMSIQSRLSARILSQGLKTQRLKAK